MQGRVAILGVLGVVLVALLLLLRPWEHEPTGPTGEEPLPTPEKTDGHKAPVAPGLRATGNKPEDPEPPAPAASTPGGRGSVVVVMVNAEGQRIEDSQQEVYLFWRAPGSGGTWQREGMPRCRTTRGEGRIDDVPVGKELQLRVIDHTYFGTVFDAAGPARAGEERTIRVPLGPRRPVLTALLVGPDGRPLARQPVTLIERLDEFLPEGPAQTRILQTDERGRVRKPMAYAPSRRVWLFLEMNRGEVVWSAEAEIPSDASGLTDLGTLSFLPTTEVVTLARGRVVDEQGAPLTGSVQVTAYAGEGAQTVVLTRTPIQVERDGSFAVRTGVSPVPESFRLQAYGAGRVRAVQEVSRGADDVVLVLRPGGRLHASFVLPEGIPQDRVVGYIQRQGSGSAGCPNQRDGHFGYDELAAGTYDIFVKIKSSPWELARVEGIVVPEGGAAEDARIRDIPLDGRVRAWRVRLLSPEGTSVAGRHVTVESPEGGRATFTARSDGTVVIVAPPRYEALTLSMPELGTTRVSWSTEEQTVTLR